MAYAKIVVQYPDDSTVVVEVGHEGGCHPDLLDEITARCLTLYVEAVGETEDQA